MTKQTDLLGAWIHFTNDPKGTPSLIPHCGKWMYFFNTTGAEFADEICQKAVVDGTVTHAKRTGDVFLPLSGTGVCCFYIDGTDKEAHRRVLRFFLENNLITRNKNGKLRNIAFKYDDQTLEGDYGNDFKAKINLSDFVNLETGEFLK